MFKKVSTWICGLSKTGKAGVVIAILLVAGVAASPGASKQPEQESVMQKQGTSENKKGSRIETKTVTETEEIVFDTITQEDSDLEKYKVLAAVSGVNGIKTLTYEIT